MKVKRYVAADIRQAIRMVREEQGPDAVILSNKRIDEGVEIIAAVDYDPEQFSNDNALEEVHSPDLEDKPAAKPQNPQHDQDIYSPQIVTDNPTAAPFISTAKSSKSATDPGTLEDVQNEIRNLRSLLENQIKNPRSENPSLSLRGKLYHRLLSMGLTSDLSKSIVKDIDINLPNEQAWHATLDTFAKRIPTVPDHHFKQGGVVALIGATGVGKTTTIAKIASRFVLANPSKKVILVTSDNYRIGGHEQLKIYARILGLPLYIIHRQQDLNEILRDVTKDQLVLIDTAGTKFRGLPTQKQFLFLQNSAIKIHTYLVLSATAQYSDLNEIVKSCSGFEITGCMATKLDESTSLGNLLSVIIQNRIPIVYVADGQKVPDDMSQPSISRLVSKCVALSKIKLKELHDEALAFDQGEIQGNEFL